MLPKSLMETIKNWFKCLTPMVLSWFIFGSLTGCTPSGPRNLLEGEKLINQGNYQKAINRLKKAVELLPNDHRSWNYLGLAYHYNQNYVEAARAYQTAISLNHNFAPAHLNLAKLYIETSNYNSAISELRSFLLLEKSSIEGWTLLGNTYLSLKQPQNAIICFRNVLNIDPKNLPAMNGLGLAECLLNKPRNALQWFAHAETVDPNFGPAILNQAILYHTVLTNYIHALQKYQKYLSLKPQPADYNEVFATAMALYNSLTPQTNAAKTQLITEQTKPGITNLAMAQPKEPNLATQTIISIQPSMTNLQPNLTNATQDIPKTNTHELILKMVATQQVITVTQAQKAAPATISQNIETPDTIKPPPEKTTNLIIASNQPTKSKLDQEPNPAILLDNLLTTKQQTPPNTATLPPLKTIAIQQPAQPTPPKPEKETKPQPQQTATTQTTQTTESKSFWNKLNPVSWFSRSHKPLGPTPLNTPIPQTNKITDSSQNFITNTVQTNITDITSTKTNQTTATQNQQTQQTQQTPIQEKVIARYSYLRPSLPPKGDRTEADKYFKQAVQNHRRGDLLAAMDLYKKAIKADPSFFEAYYNLGLVCYDLGKTDASLLAFETALAIEPASTSARYNFALALQQGKYYNDAANELIQVLSVDKSNANAHLALANLYAQQLGFPRLAAEHYRIFLALEPHHSQAAAVRYWLNTH